ncbi:effector-associated constant component EACC1 [Nonomuraea sp. CA-141351]|uniref:effector-associated constant component EACC1 n=1 Tax=Nonomuraea sp. CA-141351 TaxID=3239996 RepID=UPI003D91B9EA
MDARIELAGGDEVAESAALWEWLCGERELAGAVRVVRRPVAEGELGGALQAIMVAVASGGTGLALARSLTEWVKTRRPDITVTIKASGEMKLDARHVKSNDVVPLLQEMLRERDEP